MLFSNSITTRVRQHRDSCDWRTNIVTTSFLSFKKYSCRKTLPLEQGILSGPILSSLCEAFLLWMGRTCEVFVMLHFSRLMADTTSSWNWTKGFSSCWVLLINVGTQCVTVNPCCSRKEYEVNRFENNCSNNAAAHAVRGGWENKSPTESILFHLDEAPSQSVFPTLSSISFCSSRRSSQNVVNKRVALVS